MEIKLIAKPLMVKTQQPGVKIRSSKGLLCGPW
jgi:hypothetical protein